MFGLTFWGVWDILLFDLLSHLLVYFPLSHFSVWTYKSFSIDAVLEVFKKALENLKIYV